MFVVFAALVWFMRRPPVMAPASGGGH